MTQWLAPILGVVVVGVVIELLVKDGRMGNFIRAVYAFFVLLVIVAPLPQLLARVSNLPADTAIKVNTELVQDLQQTGQQAQLQWQLSQLGYPDALVEVVDATIYVNLGVAVTDAEAARLQQLLGSEEVIIL